MAYKGHVENGTVVLDEPLDLPEGATVSIELTEREPVGDTVAAPTLAERLSSVIGKAEGLPADWSENHDDYLGREHAR